MSLRRIQWNLLVQASGQVPASNLKPYVELKHLLHTRSDDERFKRLFASYYSLNAARLSRDFKERFFEALFAFSPSKGEPYTPLLRTLSAYTRRRALPFSFVSKLVAIHDEQRPLYDKFVSAFFGVFPPSVKDDDLRIAGFVSHLQSIRKQYADWAKDPGFPALVAPLLEACPQLNACHPHRLCDFLVWQAGSNQYLPGGGHP